MEFLLPGRAAPVIYEGSLPSTNTALRELAQQGAAHGTALIAGRQTGGRGRLGRSFESPPGGLYISVLYRPDCAPERSLPMTAGAAVAIRRAIARVCGLEPGIKWMNDLVSGGKKLCGILAEQTVSGAGTQLVVGAGINVNTRPEDFPGELRDRAGSILSLTGRETELSVLARAVIAELDGIYAAALAGGAAFLEEYRAACVSCGRDVLLLQNGSSRPARALRVNDDFSLAVQTASGPEDVRFGEVSVRGADGYL